MTAAGNDANTHGHTQNGTPEARTTTVMMSMRSQDPTGGCPELKHSAARPADVARTGVRAPGSARAETTEDRRAARLPLTGEGAAATLPMGRVRVTLAGICRDEAADDTFP
jgi:hypothetical protein